MRITLNKKDKSGCIQTGYEEKIDISYKLTEEDIDKIVIEYSQYHEIETDNVDVVIEE